MKNSSGPVALLFLALLAGIGCGGDGHSNAWSGSGSGSGAGSGVIPVLSAITVTPSAQSVTAGSTLQLSAKGTYSDGSTQDLSTQVVWKSSNVSIAGVDAKGLLSALQAGSVTVTAADGSVTGTTAITVKGAAVTLSSITITAPSAAVEQGATAQLAAQGTYSDGSTQTITSQVTWQSSDPSIASVSASGLVSALQTGSVTLTAIVDSVSGSLPFAVLALTGPSSAPLAFISVIPSQFSVASGQSKQLAAQAVFRDGTTQDMTSQAVWTTSDSSAIAITGGGLATGVSPGVATITAAIGSTRGTALGTVANISLSSIRITPPSATVARGQTQLFAANGIFSDGSSTDMTNSVTWSSGTPAIASVDAAGQATGLAVGAATIRATSGGVSGSATLTVTPPALISMDVSPSAPSIPVGGQAALILAGTYSDNTTQTITGVTWSSSDPTVALVSSTTGVVTGIAQGRSATITATAPNGATATTMVVVTSAVIQSLQLTAPNEAIPVGASQQYTVTGIASDGSSVRLREGLTWVSCSCAARISTTGFLTGLYPNELSIEVSYTVPSHGVLQASSRLKITAATLTSVVITPVQSTVGTNGTVQYEVTGIDSDGNTYDLSSQATWSSSGGTVALIDSTGLATGESAGSTTITATVQGRSGLLTGSTTLTVSSAPLTSISIAPGNQTVLPGTSVPMTATGQFSDNSQIVLAGVTWYTSDAHSAVVSSTGVVHAEHAASQPVSVCAELNGIHGCTSLTIASLPVDSLQFHNAPSTIVAGTNLPFTLTGVLSDHSTVDLTNAARWQTSDYQKAFIDSFGVVTGVAAGSATITASYAGQSATAQLAVTDAVVQNLAVTPAAPGITLGSVLSFTAMATFSDGSSQDVTSLVQWSSSDPKVACVNGYGVASSVSQGQTTITATAKGNPGSPGSAVLSVN